MLPQLYHIRHGETEWSISGQHTGHTNISLPARGEDEARELARRLRDVSFARVLTSPLLRARRTCELAAPDEDPEIELDLAEWDYGDYEGLRSPASFEADTTRAIARWENEGGEIPDNPRQKAALKTSSTLAGSP